MAWVEALNSQPLATWPQECSEIDLESGLHQEYPQGGRNHLLMDAVAAFRPWLRVTEKSENC